MQMLGVMIRRTGAGPKAKPQSAWTKWNSPSSNLPKGWDTPTLVCSIRGGIYGWVGFSRRSIRSLSWDRTVGTSCEMHRCTKRWRLKIFWRLLRPGCIWKISMILNGFGSNGWRCFWRNVQVRFGRWGSREGEATSDRRWIWESTWANTRKITSQSCQIQLWWLWFVKCQTATMTRYPALNSKRRAEMWGTGSCWLTSSKKIVVRKNHTVWLQYTNATWRRKNWMNSI